jgi:hypothetical protein
MTNWAYLLGEAFSSVKPMLYPGETLATEYPNPNNIEGPQLLVVHYPNGTIGAITKDIEFRMPLVEKDILHYHLNMSRFCKMVTELLGIERAVTNIGQSDRTIFLGHVETFPGEKHPVYLVSWRDFSQFKCDVSKLLLDLKTPFVLLSCIPRWPNEFLPHFHEHQVAHISLAEALEFRDNRFQATDVWHQTMEAFRKTLKPDNMVPAPPFEFRKKGDMWVIRFAGEDMYLKDSVGLRCIGQLLAKPNDPVFVSDLKMIIDGQNPQNIPAPTSSGEVADKQYLKDVARNYLTLQAEYEEADANGEVALANELQDQMEKLMTFLQEAKGFGGHVKEANEQLNSIRISIYRAICRTLESIKVELPACFVHLQPRISTGMVLNYVPDKNIVWVT